MVSIPPPSQYGGRNKAAGRVSSTGPIADAKQPSNRSFGLVMATFFAIIAFIPLLRTEHDTVRWWAVMVSALFLALALFWTAPLRPLNWLWTRFGDLLNRLVSDRLAILPRGHANRPCPAGARQGFAAAASRSLSSELLDFADTAWSVARVDEKSVLIAGPPWVHSSISSGST
jgi:hypothetical protein